MVATEATIQAEFDSMELPDFRRAYLNQWLDAFPGEWLVIGQADWDGCADMGSPRPGRPVAIALDVKPAREGEAPDTGCIAVARTLPQVTQT